VHCSLAAHSPLHKDPVVDHEAPHDVPRSRLRPRVPIQRGLELIDLLAIEPALLDANALPALNLSRTLLNDRVGFTLNEFTEPLKDLDAVCHVSRLLTPLLPQPTHPSPHGCAVSNRGYPLALHSERGSNRTRFKTPPRRNLVGAAWCERRFCAWSASSTSEDSAARPAAESLAGDLAMAPGP